MNLFNQIRTNNFSFIKAGLNLKSDKAIEKMRFLPMESKKNLLINHRKVSLTFMINI